MEEEGKGNNLIVDVGLGYQVAGSGEETGLTKHRSPWNTYLLKLGISLSCGFEDGGEGTGV